MVEGKGSDSISSQLLNHPDEGMADFLSRPIFIHSGSWTPSQGTPETGTLDPWTLFLTNARVMNRLSNYRLFRGRLHLRIMMNGNGFYYGRLLMDYLPLATYRSCDGYDPTVTANNVLASQRMHVYLDPSQSTTTDMVLPFFWPYDALDLTAADWQNMGRLYIRELAGLKHANAGTTPITYTIAAWLEDVMVGVPTCVNMYGITPQARIVKNEPVGPVSKVASALSNAFSALGSVPYIGPWATAASIVSSATASVAKAFGWSRPLDISAPSLMKPIYAAPFAPTDAEDFSQKVTVDSKNELSVDPDIFGYNAGDELALSHLCGIESFLTSFAWTAAGTPSTLLWNSRVTPFLCQAVSSTYYMPACMFASVPFSRWRGCMKFRFQVVASSYHRGRLLVTWDPIRPTTVEPNVQITRVIDITDEKDFTIVLDGDNPLIT